MRCGYHGLLFGPDGVCKEIPGQAMIPPKARVRTYPVVEKDNWVWVWTGDPAKADPKHICFAVGPGKPGYNIKTSKVSVNSNYRLEIENLTDLSHLTFVHKNTLGGSDAWTHAEITRTDMERGFNSSFWMASSPVPAFSMHLFPPGTLFDVFASIDFTLPCNFVLNFQVWSLGTAKAGKENGQILLDSWTSQAVTPRDADWVDYYYSWGLTDATDSPGMTDLLLEAVNTAFLEDKNMLEAQYRRFKEHPDGNKIDIKHDAGPKKMLFLLDKFLAAENDDLNLVRAKAN